MRDTCPWCGSGARRPGPSAPGLPYLVCGACGSGYLEDPELEFDAYYEEYSPALVRTLPTVVARRYAAILGRMEALVPGRRLLEVGCGNGHFLRVARGRGWGVWGTELSRRHVEEARALGLDAVHGDLAREDLWPGRTFDAVVMIEVLEHVPDPTALLRAAAAKLEPGGVAYLTTPSFGSITRRLLGARWGVLDREHVALASPAGLRSALESTGFRVLRLRSRHLYLGEYRKLFARSEAVGGEPASLSSESAALRDRIEASRGLRWAKAVANGVLGVTGLGEALEAWARREGDAGRTGSG